MGSDCLAGTVFPFGVINIFWNKIVVMIKHTVNILNVTELYTFKWLKIINLILCILLHLKKETFLCNYIESYLCYIFFKKQVLETSVYHGGAQMHTCV